MKEENNKRSFRSSIKRITFIICVFFIGGAVLEKNNMQKEKMKNNQESESKPTENFLKGKQLIANLEGVVIEMPFKHRSLWIPGNYFSEFYSITGVNALDWKDDVNEQTTLQFILPGFEPINSQNKELFWAPQKSLEVTLVRSRKASTEQHKTGVSKKFNREFKNHFQGNLQEILPADSMPPYPKYGTRDSEERRADYSLYYHWKEKKEGFHGLQWISDRFSVFSYKGKHYTAWVNKRDDNGLIDYHDEFFFTRNEKGLIDRHITCASMHKEYVPKKTVPYCKHTFFLDEIEMRVELRYFRDSLPQWREIEEKVSKMAISFSQKPKEGKMLHGLNDRKEIVRLMRGR